MKKPPHVFNRPNARKRREMTHRLLLRDGPRCTCCEVRFTFDDNPPTIEHLVPLSEGGRNTIGNLVLCCRRCNHGRLHDTTEMARTGS